MCKILIAWLISAPGREMYSAEIDLPLPASF